MAWGGATPPPHPPTVKNIKVSQILSATWFMINDSASSFSKWWDKCSDEQQLGMCWEYVWTWCCDSLKRLCFSGNSQPAEQENRCGRAREGEGGGHAEIAGKMAEYIYLLFCEMCTGVLRLTRHVAVTLSNTLVLVGSFLPSLWAVGKKQATISLLTLFFNLLYTATLRTVHPTSLSQGSQHYCHVLS